MTAKRIRDIGMPGWWTVMVIFLLDFFVSYFSQEAATGMHFLIWVILLLIPSDAIGGNLSTEN